MNPHLIRLFGFGAVVLSLAAALTLARPHMDLEPRLAHAQVVTLEQTATSGIQIQNLNTAATANVVVTFYQQGTNNTYTLPTRQIGPGAAINIYEPAEVPAGFVGSVVIESDQQVSAIARTDWSGDKAAAAYAGADAGAMSYNLPLVLREYFSQNSRFTVQNVDPSQDATVTVRIVGANLSGPVDTTVDVMVKPGFSYTWDQQAMTNLGNRFIGAAQITANRHVVAVADVRLLRPGGAVVYDYSGFAAGSTEMVAPLVRNNAFGYTTGMQIQNLSATETASVRVDYVGTIRGQGSTLNFTEQVSINPGTSTNIYHGATNAVLPPGFVGSATATSLNNVPIVGMVNDTAVTPGVNSSGAYNMEAKAAGSAKLVIPLIRNDFPHNHPNRYTTGLQVMNVGTAPTAIRVRYFRTAGPTLTQDTQTSAVVPVGGSANFYAGATTGFIIPPGFLGSALVEAVDPDQRLIGILQDASATGLWDAASFNALHAQ